MLKVKGQKLNAGQSLFEVVLALGVITMILTGVVALSAGSIRNATLSRNKTLAGKYAQEATEWLRSERDAGFDDFDGKANGTYCLKNSNPPDWSKHTSCSSSDYISGTILLRKVSFTTTTSPGGKTIIEAEVVVSWNDTQGYHEVKSATSFADWRQI